MSTPRNPLTSSRNKTPPLSSSSPGTSLPSSSSIITITSFRPVMSPSLPTAPPLHLRKQAPPVPAAISCALASELRLESLPKQFRAAGGVVVEYHGGLNVRFEAFEAFLFAYGCVVVWGSTKQLELVVGIISKEQAVFQTQDWSVLKWHSADEYRIRLFDEEGEEERDDDDDDDDDDSLLSSSSSETLTTPITSSHARLPISHALSQSAKISFLDLHARRRLPSLREHISELRTLGRTCSARATVVKSHFDFQRRKLDTHEIRGPSPFELTARQREVYECTCEVLDVKERKEELQGLLEDAADMLQCASEEVVNRQSLRIELIILVIIACQFFLCLVEMVHDNWKVGLLTASLCLCAIVVAVGAVWNYNAAQRRKGYVLL